MSEQKQNLTDDKIADKGGDALEGALGLPNNEGGQEPAPADPNAPAEPGQPGQVPESDGEVAPPRQDDRE